MRLLNASCCLVMATLLASPVLQAGPLPPAADATPPKTTKPAPKPAPAKPAATPKPAPASAQVAPASKPAAPAAATAKSPPAAPPQPQGPIRVPPSVRELRIVATVDATQEWKKNDPEHPGEQWSKGSTQQRYEITTRLRSDGKLHLRNLLDPVLNNRLEAKTIHLAHQTKDRLGKPGQPAKIPQTDKEKQDFTLALQRANIACEGDPTCYYNLQMDAAIIMAAMEYPEAMEEDSDPGQYEYFVPFDGCPQKTRVTLKMAVDGVRYNKDAKDFIPFSERRSADSIDATDGLLLCRHFLAVIDTQDKDKPMYQETIFVPRPEGMTEYTENNHTAREKQPQPMPPPAVDWMTEALRHAPASGKASVKLPLPLPLNGNATWLGLWTGTAHVAMEWTFTEVPASSTPSKP